MSLKRSNSGSRRILSCVEALESRELLSATLVQITIPVTTTPPKAVHKAAKPKVVHKAAVKKTTTSSGEEHANIGYEAFAG